MSHTLDRLTFFTRKTETFSDGHGVMNRDDRTGNRRIGTAGSTTRSCARPRRELHGLVLVEDLRQGRDRHLGDPADRLSAHASRASQSRTARLRARRQLFWYLYSANRVKYPLIRARLLKAWRAARATMAPVAAWASIQADPGSAPPIPACAVGRMVRATWDEVTEIIAAANAHTIMAWGPDRILRLLADPCDVRWSLCRRARYLQLIGGVCGSFYDGIATCRRHRPKTWGEQTDVAESATVQFGLPDPLGLERPPGPAPPMRTSIPRRGIAAPSRW